MSLQIDAFTFDCPPRKGSPWPALKMTAKRYKSPLRHQGNQDHLLTLLFFHCIGAHKEQWEPVINYLLQEGRFKVAWAFDWPTHGDAGVMNRELLNERTDTVSVYDWVPGVVQFIRSPHVQGHRLVLCGHSAGAATAVLTASAIMTVNLSICQMQISSLVLIEATLVTRELFEEHLSERMEQMDFAVSTTSIRKDRWNSREDAQRYFTKRFPWMYWNRSIIQSLVDHGLYELPDRSVMLKCDKKREAQSYADTEPHFEGVMLLNELCQVLPIHAIWGTRNDLVPDYIQDSMSSKSEGRSLASVTKVEDCGHMILQEQPIGLAEAINDALGTRTLSGKANL